MSATTWEAVWKDVVLFLPRLPASALVFLAFWIAARLFQRGVIRFGELHHTDHNLISFLGRGAKLILIGVGAISAIGTVGIDVSSLVAGLGLTGFALGFALKDTISNALSGIMIIIYKPFTSNDRISMAPFEGEVVEVNLRYTVLDMGGKKVFIPNSLLFTTPITVDTPRPMPS
jgi:small conductance mechanosensitive channel